VVRDCRIGVGGNELIHGVVREFSAHGTSLSAPRAFCGLTDA
jgi:hypothetical protein